MYIFVRHYPNQNRYWVFSVKNAERTEIESGTLAEGETMEDLFARAKKLAEVLRADYLEKEVDMDEVKAAISQNRVKAHHAEYLVKRLADCERSSAYYEDEFDKANNRHRR